MLDATHGSCVWSRTPRGNKFVSFAALMLFSVVGAIASPPAARAQERETAAKLVARTMANPEFRVKSFRGGEWLGSGDYYLALEPSGTGAGSDIVRYQTATGAREILLAASRLIPAGEKTPIPDWPRSSPQVWLLPRVLVPERQEAKLSRRHR